MRTNQRERANMGGGSNGETRTRRGQAHAGDADRRRSTAGRRLYPGWPRELGRSEPWREQRRGGRLLALRELGSSLVASGPAVGSPSPGGPQRNARRNLWFDLRPPDASTHVPAVDPLAPSGKNNNTGRGPAWLEWLSTRFEDRASISARPPRSFHRLKAAHAAAASPARPRRRTERNKTPEETTSP